MVELTTVNKDRQCNWHPAMPLKHHGQSEPLVIKRAYDSYIELADGRTLIDAISSWWCKSLGHNHPELKQRLLDQLDLFEHVIFSNTTNETIVALSQRLTGLLPELSKVYYAGDGSCAVEVAMKMSLHYRILQGKPEKTQFMALKNGYHGETMGALSVTDLELYRQPYQSWLREPIIIEPLYVQSEADPGWSDAESHWNKVEPYLLQYVKSTTAIMVEPIVQGAGGMKLYSQDFLRRLALFAKKHDIHLIADEIMTGLGRTGKMLACEHASIQPDFVCLGKGLTSGWMPFSAVLTTEAVCDVFYNQDENDELPFLHSHTFSGNALGASVALATLSVIDSNDLCQHTARMQLLFRQCFRELAEKTGMLTNIRGIGAVIAADLVDSTPNPGLGCRLSHVAANQHGVLLRPIGNVLYWLPPFTATTATIRALQEGTLQALFTIQREHHKGR